MVNKIYRCDEFILQFYNFKFNSFFTRSFDSFDDLISYVADSCLDLKLCKCFARYNNFTFYFDLNIYKDLED